MPPALDRWTLGPCPAGDRDVDAYSLRPSRFGCEPLRSVMSSGRRGRKIAWRSKREIEMVMQAAMEAGMAETDAQLIAECRGGDVDAFGRIYTRYERAIYRHAFYLLGQREDADDVKQETFLRAYRSLGSFRNDFNIRSWLYKICSNLCCDLLRRRRTRPQIPMESED